MLPGTLALGDELIIWFVGEIRWWSSVSSALFHRWHLQYRPACLVRGVILGWQAYVGVDNQIVFFFEPS